jgi:CRISPR/Cas system-associated exonuclease Cas4 (RecB family)
MIYDKPISYSSKKLYFQCPRRWHDRYILGNKEPGGPAAERGTRLHESLENFFLGGEYPTNEHALRVWADFMHDLRDKGGVPEAQLAVTKDWKPCGFKDPEAYYRGMADLIVTHETGTVIYDWKSGKIYPDHENQGMSYVAMRPATGKMTTGFVYLDHHPAVSEFEYTAADRDDIIQVLRDEIETIRNDQIHAPRGGDHCRWCRLSWRNNGKCAEAP